MTPTDTIAPQKAKQIHATALGAPRIGPNRELKKAVEDYWSGSLDARALEEVAAGLRRDTRAGESAVGRDIAGRARLCPEDQQELPALDLTWSLGEHPGHHAVDGSGDGGLHLHRLDSADPRARCDTVTDLHCQGDHSAERGAEVALFGRVGLLGHRCR